MLFDSDTINILSLKSVSEKQGINPMLPAAFAVAAAALVLISILTARQILYDREIIALETEAYELRDSLGAVLPASASRQYYEPEIFKKLIGYSGGARVLELELTGGVLRLSCSALSLMEAGGMYLFLKELPGVTGASINSLALGQSGMYSFTLTCSLSPSG